MRSTLKTLATQVGEMYQHWPDISGLVLAHERRLDEHHARLVRVEYSLQELSRRSSRNRAESLPPPPSQQSGAELATNYRMRATDTGSFRVSQEVLDQLAGQLRDAERGKQAVEAYLEAWRKRVTFTIAVLSPVAAFLGWLVAHVFHW